MLTGQKYELAAQVCLCVYYPKRSDFRNTLKKTEKVRKTSNENRLLKRPGSHLAAGAVDAGRTI